MGVGAADAAGAAGAAGAACMAGAVGAADAVELVELSCVAIAEGRMAASRADVMVASMAACGVTPGLTERLGLVDESGHFTGDNPACQETGWDERRS